MRMSNPLTRAITSPIAVAITEAIGGKYAALLPRPEFDLLLLVGSSTTAQAFNGNDVTGPQYQNSRKAMTDAGIDLPIVNRAVGGSVIADLKATIGGYMAGLGLANGQRLAVLINIGSNDIGSDAWSIVTEEQKNQVVEDLTDIFNQVTAAGHTPILSTPHSRKDLSELYETWADEIFRPLIKTLQPYWYAEPLAVIDYCRLYTENKDVVDWWHPDNVHPNLAAIPMQVLTATKMAAFSKVKAPPEQLRVIVKFQGATPLGGVNAFQGAATGNFTEVYDTNGNLLDGATFGWSGVTGGANANSRSYPGVYDIALTNSLCWGYNMYTSTVATFTFSLGPAFANRTGTLRAACSSTTADRVTRITVGGAHVDVAAGSLTQQIGEIAFTFNESGMLTFTAQKQAGTFANLCAFEFVLD